MSFICGFHRQNVQKAKTRRKTTRTYKRLEALSMQMAAPARVNLIHGLTKFKSKISAPALQKAWASGDYSKIMTYIPWDDLPEDMAPGLGKIGATAFKAGFIARAALPAPVQSELRYDLKNPQITSFIKNRTGELITNIQSNTREIVQNAVARSFSEAISPRDVADQIKDSIGLHPRQEIALERYRSGLVANEVDPDKVASLTSAYGDRLLDQRMMTIARTETRFATNQGQLSVWRQAAEQDLIDPETSRKVWVVDGNPCEICEPMDGVSVPLDDEWELNTGDSVDTPTEAHPNCYCGMEMEFGENKPEDKGEEDEQETAEE